MLYFYRKNEPIPINLFYPRLLINGPSVLYKPLQIRLDNFEHTARRYTGFYSLG
jgi:hypothetical protein